MTGPFFSSMRRMSARLPSELPGLVAWGEGSDLTALGNGASIASWLNLTRSGIDPAQGTVGNRPTVATNAINGQTAALFTRASSQGLLFPAGANSWFRNTSGATMLAVLKTTSPTVAQFVLPVNVNGSVSTRLSVQLSAASKVTVFCRSDDSTSSSTTGATAINTSPAIVGCACNFAAGVGTVLVNGVMDGSFPIAPAQTMVNTASSGVGLGARSDLSAPFDGYLAAYAMWNVPYALRQLTGVLNRWAEVYGIAAVRG